MADQLFLPRATDADNAPVSGAKALFYATGSVTPITVYADDGLTTAHPTPLVADADGVFPQVFVVSATLVKLFITDASDVSLPGYPVDPAFLFSASSSAAASVTFSPISGNAATNVQAAIANLQTGKQAAGATLAALAGLATGVNRVPYSTGIDAFDQLDFVDEDDMASDSATAIPSQQSVKAYVDALPFSESYTSAEHTITSGGALTLAHGLSATPSLIQLRLKCTSAEAGYSVDDEVIAPPSVSPAGQPDRGVSVVVDATNVSVRFGSNAVVFGMLNKSTGDLSAFTNTNWRLIVRAWA